MSNYTFSLYRMLNRLHVQIQAELLVFSLKSYFEKLLYVLNISESLVH